MQRNKRKQRNELRQAHLVVEPLESRELLDAATTANFVSKIYPDLLNRPADTAGLNVFGAALQAGQLTRPAVVTAIEASPEYRTGLVQGLYSQLLHRSADAAGLTAFTNFLGFGGTPEQVAALLAGSAEYFQSRGGSSNDGFLNALYADVLHRTVDAGGRTSFDQLLGMGVSRIYVANVILTSQEYRQDLVQSYYQRFLHRAADTAGLTGFVSVLQSGGTDNTVIASILSSEEYAPGANDPPNSDPAMLTTDPLPGFPGGEVGTLLERAAAATASHDAIIAIVDRAGNILGVRVESGVSPTLMANPATATFAIDGAVAEARTAAFFANDSGIGTPLTTRTIRDLSQSTMTQREVMSDPDILDPNSVIRGPGFVAPIGIGGHFPPGVAFTPSADLYDIESTNRDSIISPGPDGVFGTPDDIALPNRFNVPNNLIPPGQQMNPPISYGLASGIFPDGQSRGIGTLPGGIPIYKTQFGQNLLVGGIGIFFPGATGFATEENSSLGATFNPTKPDRSLEAEYIALAAVGGAPGLALPIGTLDGVPRLPEIILPATPDSVLTLVGITLSIVGPGGPQLGPNALAAYGATLGTGSRFDGLNYPVTMGGMPIAPTLPTPMNPMAESPNTMAGVTVPEGWLVTPHAGSGLTADDVVRIVTQGILQANTTRAAIRLPADTPASFVFAVSDRAGNLLGVYRMRDATVFSIAVAVAKSRNVAYYSDPTQLQPIDQVPGLPPGAAASNRTFRFLALPNFPVGINGAPPGPFSILNDPGTNPNTGLQVGPPLPPSAYTSVQGHNAFFPDSNFRDPNNVANQDGIVFFPGSVPLYKTVNGIQVLVGGLGVSGDGVTQDDVVTFAASQGYLPAPTVPTADFFFVNGVRLPYQKFDRNPDG
ncbi:MAG TPA: DUF4214 domain-containing protein [Gemmataceae bacterium]|jgi:uncharacterized protein GlcG (DUF336 family)|nr:DUF4214 domain-containing protein [Gemmataceae bacterium]